MKTKQVQISEQNARKLYPSAPAEIKAMLEDTFGKEFFSQDICERINGLDDCYTETGRPVITDFSIYPEDLRPFMAKVYDGVVMAQAYNQGIRANYKDANQKKWRVWFNQLSSGGVDYGDALYNSSLASAGDASRLALLEKRTAEDAFKKFPQLYEAILNL